MFTLKNVIKLNVAFQNIVTKEVIIVQEYALNAFFNRTLTKSNFICGITPLYCKALTKLSYELKNLKKVARTIYPPEQLAYWTEVNQP